MSFRHEFPAQVKWTGNLGPGNRTYKGYERRWQVTTPGKPVIECSNDPLLGGDPTLHNPEDLLIATVSACHMLWYLHLAQREEVVVEAYRDNPVGIGESDESGAGRFVEAILRPEVTLAPGMDVAKADRIHADIHKVCFIANSVAFPIRIEARYGHLASSN